MHKREAIRARTQSHANNLYIGGKPQNHREGEKEVIIFKIK